MRVAVAQADNYQEHEVRRSFEALFDLLGYDGDNPLGGLIRPGDRVFIKPNWVAHEYRKSCPRQDSVFSTITHPVVIRVLADYVARALGDRGQITIGDNPSIDADFDRLRELVGLDDLRSRHASPCELVDLRPLRCADLKDYGRKHRMKHQPGDPRGATTVNLGKESLFYGINPLLFRGVFNSRWETIKCHWGKRQEYAFSNSIAQADVYISVPKLKTHHKCGATLNLKGLVGTISAKNLLVHWRTGWPALGGDEYPDFATWWKGLFRKVKNRGAWSGNDTIWRMVVDIYHAFNRVRKRKAFSIVDGIIGGEGDGPFCPTSKHSGVLLAGEDLLAVDCAASALMGFDIRAIPYLNHFLNSGEITCAAIDVRSRDFDLQGLFEGGNPWLGFRPPTQWPGLVAHQLTNHAHHPRLIKETTP
jgi:uncharacterized protein (DUF362 family)